MIPTQFLARQVGILLAADTDSLAFASGLQIGLVKGPFTPGPNLTKADLVTAGLADFTGSTPKDVLAGAPPVLVDPNTGEQVIQIEPATGAFVWTPSDGVNLPQQIHGYYLEGKTTLGPFLCASLLDSPVTLSTAGEYVEVVHPALRVVLQPMS